MKLVSITPSTKPEKRLTAVFESGGRKKTVHFGLKSGSTYIDHGDLQKRGAYLARHAANEDWNKPDTAGSLSRWILWGNNKSLTANISDFKKRFNL